jgi:hypothetical protein
LTAALHYYHVARRLLASSHSPGEFLAETLLNYAKALEVLYPPHGKVKQRDSVRAGLAELGYTSDEIESHFVPLLIIRNELDVGHVGLAHFSLSQRTVLYEYAFLAEGRVGELMSRALDRATQDPAAFLSAPPAAPSSDKVALIRTMEKALASESAA